MRFFLYTGVVFVLFIFPFLAVSNAQTVDPLAGVELSINLSPEFPQANKSVNATVSSLSENVRNATIVWLLDNEIKQQEDGGVNFEFLTGAIGSSQRLSVLVKTTNGQVFSKTVTVRPAEVTLLWEAQTYTPPFYEGRSLYSAGSKIRMEAIPYFINPKGGKYSESELIYTWSRNGTVLGSLSGIGASILIIEGPKFFGKDIVSVTVSTQDATQSARSSSLIETFDPEVLLYEIHPLYGVQYSNVIDENYNSVDSSQIEVQATPYFMDTEKENDQSLLYQWRVNEVDISNTMEDPSKLTIQLSSEDAVTTSIRIVIDHTRHLLQTAKGVFTISFEGSARNSLFGL